MRLLTKKQENEIKNQALNKIYRALQELDAKGKLLKKGYIGRSHDEILHIALSHLNTKPSENVYPWIKKGELKGSFLS